MRSALCTAVYVVSASPLLAGLATAYQDDTHFYLENDVLKIAVLQTTGNLDGIIHKQSGVNLQSNSANDYPGMWAMSLNASAGTNFYVQTGQAIKLTGTITNTANGAALNLTWNGLQYLSLPNGVTTLPNVTVKVQISVQTDSELSYWTFEADGLGSNSMNFIEFPYIAGIGPLGQSGEDDVLLTSEVKGMLYHNPTSTVQAGTYPGGFYPGGGGLMQMLAFFDPTSGFYFASDDIQGNTKDYFWAKSSSPAGDYTINLQHFPTGLPADTVQLPYNVIVGATQGDWYAAADMYRTWAVQQPWTQQSQTKTVPAWLHDMPLIRATCAHGCGSQPDQAYATVVQEWQQSQQSLGVTAMGQLWGWEKYGEWVEGDYLPPEEGWQSFDAMVQQIPGGRLNLLPSALFLDTGTALYTSGAMAPSAMLDQQGRVRTYPGAGANPGDTWAFMDFSTDPWRQNIVSTYQTLAGQGVDLLQLDSSMVLGPQPCYNPAHAHPPGEGGNWQTLAWIDITQRIAAAVAAVNPSAALSAEEPAEVYLPYLAVHAGGVDSWEVQTTTNTANQEPVPLFQYVYHDSILFVDFFDNPVLDGSFFQLQLARDLTWGQMPNYHIPLSPSALLAAAQTYLQAAIAARTTYAKKFLVDGIMLPAPELNVPTTQVSWINWSQNDTQMTGQYPSVQESAWLASDGSIGIVMTNISPGNVTFSLPISYSRLELPSGAAYTIQTTDGSSTTTLDSNMIQDSSYLITLASQQILLVLLTPKADLTISKTHFGSFTQGQQNATYQLTVSNAANAGVTSGTVMVTETIPSGLTLVSMAGMGWACPGTAANNCTRNDGLAAGQSYPAITVTVNVAGNATSPQVNAAAVSGGGSANANTTDSTVIAVNPPVLSISKTHVGNLTQGQQNAIYTVTVSNGGAAGPSSGAVTVTETIPSGLTLVSMAGTGWACPGTAANNCARADALAAGQSYPAITVAVNVAANATSPQVNAVALSGGGSAPANANDSTTILPLPSTPSVSGVSPGSGSGMSQTFTFTFSDAAGWQKLGVQDILVNSALDGRHACYIAYVPSGATTGSLYLVDDAGDAGGPYTGMVLPSSQTASNSQCTINGTGSSASGSGNTLTLTLAITFSSSFAGNKIFYLASADTGTGNSGWQTPGTWTVPGPPPTGPAVGGVSPARSTTLSQTYTFTFTDTNGWQDLAVLNVLINTAIDGRHACYLAYVPSGANAGSLFLVDDAGDSGGPFTGFVLPGSGAAQNSQCMVGGAGSSVTATGNTLTLTLPITFTAGFAGNQVFFLAARSNTVSSNWQAVGSVTVP